MFDSTQCSGQNRPRGPHVLRLCMSLMLLMRVTLAAETLTGNDLPNDRRIARSSAVALNYSRASLHRIRQNPSLRVLQEEQEKILNQLDLNGVADEDVLRLYTGLLEEISQIQLADHERDVVREKFRRSLHRDLSLSAFTLATAVATAQYGQAARAGATSWWDFRSATQNKELDLWRIDKDRLTRVVEKSAQFLDTSWKMARQRNIPDRWMVRNDDLDRLDDAWKQVDPQVRLRVLKRMESFMECYPPYWYYVARTQQQLGQMFAAAETYAKLTELGSGHFRKDEMLASAMANRAVIQAYLGQPGAAESALAALRHSTDVWEANLLCAQVLQNYGHNADAEDAILRNLDVPLERPTSLAALVGHYCHANESTRLTRLLAQPDMLQEIPAPVLVLAARHITDSALLAKLTEQVSTTISLSPQLKFGRDSLVVTASSRWKLPQARVAIEHNGNTLVASKGGVTTDGATLLFEDALELGSPLHGSGDVPGLTLVITYPDSPAIRLSLQRRVETVANRGPEANHLVLTSRRPPTYRIATITYEGWHVDLAADGRPKRERTADISDVTTETMLRPEEHTR